MERFTSEVAQTYYFMVGITRSGPVEGVMSADTIVVDVYDTDNYRDDFFNTATAGNLLLKMSVGTSGGADGEMLTQTNPDSATFTESSGTHGLFSVPDSVSHTSPRQELKKRTLIRYWSGPYDVGSSSGTGNILFHVWADELTGVSKSAFTYLA